MLPARCPKFDLNVAELGLNLADKKLYSKDGSGNVFQIGAAGEVPSGDTAGRPGSPSVGDLYFDTDLDLLIYWNGSEWVEVGAGALKSWCRTPHRQQLI